MKLEPIAVLGGGHGAHAMAADLALAGHEVRLCEHPRFAERFRPTLNAGRITLGGIGRSGQARPALITTDFAAALHGARLVNVVTPAFGHELFFEAMLPHLEEEQAIVLWAGDFGSLRLEHLLAAVDEADRPAILETSTLPYAARLTGPASVDILLRANRILVAALPASETDDWLPGLVALWPEIEPAQHVLQVAFSNPNPIVHPAGCLLNVGRIEHTHGNYYMYREGLTPAVRRVIRTGFEEMRAVAAALGFELAGFADADFDKPASVMGEVFVGAPNRYEVCAGVKGPTSLQDRYLTEDLPFGLLPVSQLGDVVGVETPTIDAIIQMGSIVCEHDFRREGRTLESLGLANRDATTILHLVTGA
jgi:opine dehydrogenase